MLSLDCKTCHKEAEASIGPAFIKVAERYQKQPDAMNYLSQKIINGGKGVWGEVAMAAHPNIAPNDLQQIVSWILSLADKSADKKSLPAPEGSYTPGTETKPGDLLVLSANYTDKGNNNGKALTGSNFIVVPGNYRSFSPKDEVKGFQAGSQSGNAFLRFPDSTGWFAVDSLDLSGVRSVTVVHRWRNPPESGFGYEVRLDAVDGKVVGNGNFVPTGKNNNSGDVRIALPAVEDKKFHKLYFIYKPKSDKTTIMGGATQLVFSAK
jgi:cytochrome c551/c552